MSLRGTSRGRLRVYSRDRSFIRLGDFFEGAAERRDAIGALTFTIAFTIVIAAVVHFWSA